MNDIAWFRDYRFDKESQLLGPVKMSVTVINAGTQHNVIPDKCTFVVDIRSNELYSNEDLFAEIKKHISCEAKARSFRLISSLIDEKHPFVQKKRRMLFLLYIVQRPLPLGGAAHRRRAEQVSKQGLISSKKLADVYKSEKRAKNL